MTNHRQRDQPFICRTCRGPCPRYAGPLGWLCDTCITNLIVRDDTKETPPPCNPSTTQSTTSSDTAHASGKPHPGHATAPKPPGTEPASSNSDASPDAAKYL